MSEPLLRWSVYLWRAQRGLCFHCGTPMQPLPYRAGRHKRNRRDGWTREHVVPKSLGGRDHWFNIVLVHYVCNQARGVRLFTEEEWARARALWEHLPGTKEDDGEAA